MYNELKTLDNNILNMSKDDIQLLTNDFMQTVYNGEVDTIKAFVFSQKLLELSSQINAKLKEEIKGTKGEFNGLRISEVKTGSRFDFSGCGSIKLAALNDNLASLKDAIKCEENFLKSLKEPLGVYDPETGETFELKPPVNTYSLSIKVEWL